MAQSEQEEERGGFKVVDRRRFNTDGTMKADAPPDPPSPPPEAPAPKAAPEPAKAASAAPAGAGVGAGPADEDAPESAADAAVSELFLGFVQSLGQQALMQLGLVPYPDTGLVEQSLPMARQTIDILSVVHAKTRGNLTAREERFMDGLVHDLRMAYVKVTEAQLKQAVPPDLRKKAGPAPRR